MIQVQINEEELKEIYLQKLDECLKKIESEVFFFDSKALCKFVGMSWTSVNAHLMSDPDFPVIRLGSKFLYPRQEVENYMKNFYWEVRNNGGNVLEYKQKNK